MTALRRLAASRAARAGGALVGLGLFALLLLRLRELWSETPVALEEVSWPPLVAGLALSVLALLVFGAAWAHALRVLGASAPRGLVAAFAASQVAKYLPGGAWQYLGRLALAARLGVAARPAAVSMAVEALCAILAAAILAPLALEAAGLPPPAAAATALALAVLVVALVRLEGVRRGVRAVLRRAAGADARLAPAALRRALGGYLASLALSGVALWLIARGIGGAPAAELLLFVGAWAAAWTAGLVVVVAPGGIGVREVVLVACLTPGLGEARAILVAAASRVALTVVDLVLSAGGVAALRRAGVARKERAGAPGAAAPGARRGSY